MVYLMHCPLLAPMHVLSKMRRTNFITTYIKEIHSRTRIDRLSVIIQRAWAAVSLVRGSLTSSFCTKSFALSLILGHGFRLKSGVFFKTYIKDCIAYRKARKSGTRVSWQDKWKYNIPLWKFHPQFCPRRVFCHIIRYSLWHLCSIHQIPAPTFVSALPVRHNMHFQLCHGTSFLYQFKLLLNLFFFVFIRFLLFFFSVVCAALCCLFARGMIRLTERLCKRR